MISGFAAGDGALLVVDATGGVEAGLELAVAQARSRGRAAVLLHQQERPRERRSERGPRCAPDRVRQQGRAAPPGHRGRRDVQRLRRPRPPQGVPVGRQAGSRDRDPGRARSRGRHPARSAPRGSRRGRRRRPDEVPRGRGDQRPGARGVPAQGRQGVDPRPGPRRQCHQGHRPARAARRVHPLSPVTGRRAAGRRARAEVR